MENLLTILRREVASGINGISLDLEARFEARADPPPGDASLRLQRADQWIDWVRSLKIPFADFTFSRKAWGGLFSLWLKGSPIPELDSALVRDHDS